MRNCKVNIYILIEIIMYLSCINQYRTPFNEMRINPFPVTFKKKKLLWYIYLILLTPVCLELALRLMSAEPYIQQNYSIQSSPQHAYIGHDSLGIALNPGTYQITHNKKHSFKTTHNSDHTRRVENYRYADTITTSIGFFGCSFTYGYGVNDDEHYVSLLQKKYLNNLMTNYGVIGYGTAQSVLQLKQLEGQNQLPDKVVLGFATDHFERNALTNQYRRALKIGFDNSLETAKTSMKQAKFPYLENSDEPISFEHWNALYEDWLGRDRFASINFIQTQSDKIADNQRDVIEISYALIHRMYSICKKNNIEFLIVLIDENTHSIELKQKLESSEIPFVDVHFNFESDTYTNLPYDMHPNAKGHAFIAKQISSAFKTLMQSE